MAIGKPLLVTERQGVAQPVLTPQTQQLSSNVPVQKIALADYNIGMQNVKSSFAVSDELVNMVEAGVKAKLFIDNTKREYARLNLMEGWNQANLDAKAEFSKATTPEGQMEAIEKFKSTFASNTKSWTDLQGNTPQSQQQLVWLRNNANQQLSQMEMTHQNTLVKRTSAQHQLTMNKMGQSLVQDKNADPVAGLQVIKDGYGALIKIGEMTQEQALAQFELQKDKIIAGRATLFGRDRAKAFAQSGGVDLPTDKQLKSYMQGVMGMPLSDRRMQMISESFTDSYYKEITESLRQAKAEETYALESTEQGRIDYNSELNEELNDRAISPEREQQLIAKAEAFDYADPSFSTTARQKIDQAKHGAAYQPFVDYFTQGDGRIAIRDSIPADGGNYYDPNKIREYVNAMGGQYEGMNEATLIGITRHWRGVNAKMRTDLLDQSEDVIASLLSDKLKNPDKTPDWLSDKTLTALKATGMLNKLKAPDVLNWSKAFNFSPAHSAAYSTTLADLAKAESDRTGPFDPKIQNLPTNEQRAFLTQYTDKLLEANFSKAVNEALSKQQAGVLDKRQKAEEAFKTGAKEKFKWGGVDATGQMYPGAYETRMDQISPTELAKEGATTFDVLSQRIDKELKRKDYDELSTPVKILDSMIPTGPDIVEGTISTFKNLGSAIIGNTPTAYITGLKNKQLQDNIEAQLKRPLTKAELAGKNELVNEMARTMIQSETDSTIGKMVDWVLNAGEPSERQAKIDRLTYELKYQSLEGIKRGMESVKPTPTPASKALPVAETPATATDDLATGAPANPILNNLGELASAVSSLVTPSEAEGVTSISRDSSQGLYDKSMGDFTLQPGKYSPDSWNPGKRYLDANGEFTDVMPLDVRDRVLSEPESFPEFTTYNLVQGDNLSRVAERAGISLEELQNLNSNTIGNETSLQIGDPILLPQGSQMMPNVPLQTPVESDPMAFDDALMNLNPTATTPVADTNNLQSNASDLIKVRETSTTDAARVIALPLQDNGNAAGWGHTFQGNEKAEWEAHPLDTEANKQWRINKVNEWFTSDLAKAKAGAKAQLKELGRSPSSANAEGFKDMLTFMNFQLGSAWHKPHLNREGQRVPGFKKAWAGLKRGDAKGRDGMFRDKSGWEQAIYHLMFHKEGSDTPSGWLTQSPTRVMDAVRAVNYMSQGTGTESLIGYIDSILKEIP